jgi:transposase
MKPYSMDLRLKIFQACERGVGSQRAVAEWFGVSLSFVEKLLIQFRSTGNVEPKPHGGGTPSRIDAAAQLRLQQWLQEQPDLTLVELADRLNHTLGIPISVTRLCRILKQLDVPRKKRRSTPRSVTANE